MKYERNVSGWQVGPVVGGMMREPRTILGLVVAFVAMTFASFRVTISAADLEPFFAYYKADALYYVGFAAVLMLLWLQLAIGLTVLVIRRRAPAWWLVGALWSLLGLFCVATAVDTWTSDMEDHGFQPMTAKPTSTEPK
jgi:hypothetical protein